MTNADSMPGNLKHLHNAVLVLLGPGPVKQRLSDAAVRHLREVDSSQLPKAAAAACRELMDSLRTAQAVGGLSSTEATVRKMSEQEAAAFAARVLELYVTLSSRDARDSPASAQRQLRLVGDE
jgi:hypothetical protein